MFSAEDGRTYMRMTASTFVMKEEEIAELKEQRRKELSRTRQL